jgi:multidrug efflux system membrane fusion protein
VPVTTAPVKSGSIDVSISALGTVTPVSMVTVTSRVVGELREVDYTEGQIVKKGDLLAVIDPQPYQAVLTQAEGQLERDQALLKNATIDLERYQTAYTQHAIPEQQVATQQTLVSQDEGIVKVDQGALNAARVNLQYTRITSPIDGRVGLRMVDPGNIVQANGTNGLLTIAQLQPITVIFTIAEDNLSAVVEQMRDGHPLRVDALDRTQQKVISEGTLLTIDNQIDPTTGTVKARAIFPNAKDELFPNQFVNAKLYVRTLSPVNLVPSAAIQRNGDESFVYVVQADGSVKSQDIKIAATDADVTAVTGVNAGDTLVTDGFDRLQNGTKVTSQQTGAADKPAAGGPMKKKADGAGAPAGS